MRSYLAALGAVPLLKREEEVALAKQIERGEKMVMTAVSRSPEAIEALILVGKELKAGLGRSRTWYTSTVKRRRRKKLNSIGR